MSTTSLNQEWFSFPGTKDNYRTMVYYPGTGGDTFEFNFEGGYINRTDIKAFMVKDDTRDTEYLTLTFKGPNTVQTNKPVPAGWTVCIFRDTPKAEPLAKYQDGAVITAENLDRNAQQAMFAVSEMVDRFDSTVSQVDIALKAVYEATQTADAALEEAKKATGIAQGAVSKADSAITTANRAEVTSNAASQKAEQAAQTALDAKNTATALDGQIKSANATAQAANQTAADAKRISEGVDGKATQAQSDAAAAVKTATEAKQIAQNIDAKATQAQKDAAAALQKANEVESSVGTVQELSRRVKEFGAGDRVEWKGRHRFGDSWLSVNNTAGQERVGIGAREDSGYVASFTGGSWRYLDLMRGAITYDGTKVHMDGSVGARFGESTTVSHNFNPTYRLQDSTRATYSALVLGTSGLPYIEWGDTQSSKGRLNMPSTGGVAATEEFVGNRINYVAPDTWTVGNLTVRDKYYEFDHGTIKSTVYSNGSTLKLGTYMSDGKGWTYFDFVRDSPGIVMTREWAAKQDTLLSPEYSFTHTVTSLNHIADALSRIGSNSTFTRASASGSTWTIYYRVYRGIGGV